MQEKNTMNMKEISMNRDIKPKKLEESRWITTLKTLILSKKLEIIFDNLKQKNSRDKELSMMLKGKTSDLNMKTKTFLQR